MNLLRLGISPTEAGSMTYIEYLIQLMLNYERLLARQEGDGSIVDIDDDEDLGTAMLKAGF